MVSMKLKGVKFNPRAISGAVKHAKPSVMRKQAAIVRKTAAWSIRKRKMPSAPGQVPHSHTGFLKRFLRYDYDPTGDGAAVIGPKKTNQVFFDGDGQPVTGTIPNVLEFGGRITVAQVFKPWLLGGRGKWVRIDLRSKRRVRGLKKRSKTINIAARPYMGPALEKAKDVLADFWGGQVRGR